MARLASAKVERSKSDSSVPLFRLWSVGDHHQRQHATHVIAKGLTQQTGAHGVGVLACAAQGLDFEGAAFDFTYLEFRVRAFLGFGRLCAACHLLGVLRFGILGHEVGVNVGDELGRRRVSAEVGHLVGDGGGGVGHVRDERLLRLEFAVLLGRVVCPLVERGEVGLLPGCGGGEGSTTCSSREDAGSHCQPCGCHCGRCCQIPAVCVW